MNTYVVIFTNGSRIQVQAAQVVIAGAADNTPAHFTFLDSANTEEAKALAMIPFQNAAFIGKTEVVTA